MSKPRALINANMNAHLIVENEKQENCEHLGWEKVEAFDETYWRCSYCSITNETPLSLDEIAKFKPFMQLPEWRREATPTDLEADNE